MTHSNHRILPMFLMTIALLALGGCDALRNDDKDSDRGSERIGTSVDVPKSATVEAEGRGQLSYKARDDGTVYLYDMQDRRVVDTQRVRRGERYTADLDKDLATLDGQPVFERNLEKTHRHRIYFDPGRFR